MSGETRRTAGESGSLLWGAVLVHALFLASLVFGFLNPLFDDATHRVGQGADFYAVVQAGQNVLDGVSIYEKQPAHRVVPYFYFYRYLPFSALTLGQVFRLVPPETAYGIWIVANEMLLLLNIALIRRLFASKRRARIATALCLAFTPYYLELYMGQYSFLMATLLFWMLYHWTSGRRIAGDLFWTLSILLKTNTGIFIPALVKAGRWKMTAWVVAAVVLLSAPYFLLVPGTWEGFVWNLTEGLSAETLAGNQGFAGLLSVAILRGGGHWIGEVHRFFWNLDAINAIIRTPILLWSILILLVSLLITYRAPAVRFQEIVILWLLTYFLTYKHIWEHHYVMMLPVFVLLYRQISEQPENAPVGKRLFWLSYALVALPTPFIIIDQNPVLLDPEYTWSALESLAFHAAKPAATLALYASIGVSLWGGGPAAARERDAVKQRPKGVRAV